MPGRALICVCLALSAVGDVFAASGMDYERLVKPLFRQRCYACHGALKQESGLRLDTGALIRRGSDGGGVVTPGKPDDSLLMRKISTADLADRMPPEGEPLAADQIAAVRDWIAQGATAPADESPEADPAAHWAFQPVARPPLPRRTGLPSSSNPVDVLIDEQLAEAGIAPRPAAPRHVLLRRVYLDLIGMPPTRDELLAFLADDAPDAYERVVERLLASPLYGERWGRHWMDVWRYSDWYGRRHVPDVWNSAPQIWRWRDWIVQSLNEDKGYDQMVREMLAGDEIAPENLDVVVATGYLVRNWYALNPNDWMRNIVEHTGKAFLGLTFNCCHCHDHKYDPLAQDDYFRMRAFFEPLYVRQDRMPGEGDPGPFQDYNYSTLRKIERLGAVRVFDKTPEAPTWFYTGGDERNRVVERKSIAPGVPSFLDHGQLRIEPVTLPPLAWYPGLDPAIQQTVLRDALAAVEAAEAALASCTNAPAGIAGAALSESPAYAAALAQAEAKRLHLASVEARIAADRARYGETLDEDAGALARNASGFEQQAHACQLDADVKTQQCALAEANARPADDAQREPAAAAAQKKIADLTAELQRLQAQPTDAAKETYTPLTPVYSPHSTGRRKGLAEWIASRRNPLTARVAVNHVWMRHFHAPLVTSVYDFGRNGARPTHPKLLDWLAAEWMESGWRFKHLHRLIVTSDAYRRDSAEQGRGEVGKRAALESDPENRLLWRMNVGRMEAEAVRDSLLFVADRLDFRQGGQELENEAALTTHRRSLYYCIHPEQGGKSQLGELFDAPDPLDCYRRSRSIVPQQALALTNSELVHELSREIVRRTGTEGRSAHSGPMAAAVVCADERFAAEMFERILSRQATADERRVCRDAMERFRALHGATGAATSAEQALTRSREALVRALLNHNDFVTIR